MPRRTRTVPMNDTFSIWTSFTDLMSNAFMIMTLLLLLVIARNSKNNDVQIGTGADEKPTIIELPSAKYEFPSGSAVLPRNLKTDIGQNGIILKEIENNIKQIENSNKKVDVIEVIGHTDGEEVGYLKCSNQNGGNLDTKLEEVATRNRDVSILCPGSNADLGLMRALAVVKELQNVQRQQKSGLFKQLKFRAYSAAQLLLPDDRGFAPPDRSDNPKRRRIEIRFAQLGQYKTIGNNR
ncbi:flagellar motor protein [Calothrix sp. FACHB-1219]|uniref:flagellar motor protein n=1 Tax=unclassified Calothrix TaxID=2619626 RepID=UPI001681D46B|nr:MULTISPECIES: flagellar motor protein [unclassified Calothrix]MBD2203925.1 flagellar motor protein [Calothrix sp. FACHB-168]MBD2218290.1 flagellar motor protein [Calothrix sp. FACHB-1219]